MLRSRRSHRQAPPAGVGGGVAAQRGCAASLLAVFLWIPAGAPDAAAQIPVTIVPDNYPTIQAALDAGASTILVRPGTYPETPVITTIPRDPEPSNDDLVIRGMVPDGTPPDSFPVVAGLLFDDFTRGFVHSPSITIANLRFSKPVENAFDTAPFSNPLEIILTLCVFDQGISDARASVGGQLEYYFNGCTIDGGTRGAVYLVQPDRAFIDSCHLRDRVIFGARSWSTFFTLSNCRVTAPGSWQAGVGVDVLYVENDINIRGNTFEGYEVPLRVQRTGGADATVDNNTFRGPGTCGVDFGDTGEHFRAFVSHNSISGFDVGVRMQNTPGGTSVGLNSAENRIEHCGVAGILVTGADGISSTRDTIISCGAGAILHATETYATPGVGVYADVILSCAGTGLSIWAEHASIYGNVVGRCKGDGIVASIHPSQWWETARIWSNTSFLNAGSGHVLTRSPGGLPTEVDHNLSLRNGRYGFELVASDSSTIGCNNWFADESGAVLGAALSPTDLAVDPLSCNISESDVHLAADSPLLNAAGCGLIGALGLGCETTPVLVDQFMAWRRGDGHVVIGWRIRGDATAQVRVERAEHERGPWMPVSGVPESLGSLLTLVDPDAEPGLVYWYRLIEDNSQAGAQVLATTFIDSSHPGSGFRLEPIGSSPGDGPFTIRFSIPVRAAVDLQVFDMMGRRVAQLASGEWPAGSHEASWSGRDPGGQRRAGVYVVRYRFPGGRATRSLALIR